MTLLIRGGYDAMRKQIVNISLKRTDKWMNGLLMVQKNMYVGSLLPANENYVEIVKYGDSNVLLLNNNIVYENKTLFTYKLELQPVEVPDLNDPKLYDFLEYHYVDFYAMKHFGMGRGVN